MAMEIRTELTDDSICTLSFSFLLTTTGVISNSLLLLLQKRKHTQAHTWPYKVLALMATKQDCFYLLSPDFDLWLVVSLHHLALKVLQAHGGRQRGSYSVQIRL